ncbi:MAG: tetratricopeptide repeat protein [Acidobacteriota bacterium]
MQQATQAARRAVGLDEHLVASLTSMALVSAERGETTDAARSIDQALAIDPLNADVHYAAGMVATKTGDIGSAIDALRKAVELDGERSAYLDDLGSAYLRSGQLDAAEGAFTRSVELAGDNVYSRRNLAVIYQMHGRYDEALTHLQKALEIRPSATLYGNLGTLLFFQGLYQAAADAYEKALEFEGAAQQAPMWANLGDAYRFVPGSDAQAREAFEHAIRLIGRRLDDAPGDDDTRTRLATYLAKVDRCDDALREIAAAVPEANEPGQMRLLYRQVLVEELCRQRDAALRSVSALLDAGYSAAALETDPELRTLRADRRFQAILTSAIE